VDNAVYNLVDNSVDKIGKMNNGGENKQVMPPHFVRIKYKSHALHCVSSSEARE